MPAVLFPNGIAGRRAVHWLPGQCYPKKLLRKAPRHCCHLTPRCSLRTRRLGQSVKQRRTQNTKTQSLLGFVSYVSPSRDFFEAAINSLVGGSAMICFALAFVPLLTYEAESEELMEPDDLETVKWSVASVISCFPYLNWTVERVAQTEPAILGNMVENRPELPSIFGEISQSINQQLPSIVSKSRLFSGKESGDSLSKLVNRELTKKEKDLQDAEELARMEQQFWDEKFKDGNNKK